MKTERAIRKLCSEYQLILGTIREFGPREKSASDALTFQWALGRYYALDDCMMDFAPKQREAIRDEMDWNEHADVLAANV